jgi:Tol biopolymer transport system component
MTTEQRLERDLPTILGDLAVAPYPDYIDDVLATTAQRRQRPAWTFPERWLPMADVTSRPAVVPRVPWRTIGTGLVILAILVGAAIAYVGTRPTRLPPPFGPAANGLIPYTANGDIFVGDPVTGATRLVVGGLETDELPQFSPDGTRIAFIRQLEPGPFTIDIYVARQDGSDVRRVTPAPIDRWERIAWTPDGLHIAAIHDDDRLDLFDAGGSGTTTHLTTAVGMNSIQFRPPDGGQILYRALVDGGWGLFAMDADGGNVQTLHEPTVPAEMDMAFSGATYSSDGRRIFYEHGDESGCCRLWVMNADGTDKHEFLPRGEAWDGQAVVSPNGVWVAYWHHTDAGHITVVRADGTGPVIETGPPLPSTAHWVWSPDSSTILMFRNDVQDGNAYMLDPSGGPWTNVPWESIGDIDWQRLALTD